MLLWLWCRPAAAAPIQPLAWKPPYAEGAALEKAQKDKKEKKKKNCAKSQQVQIFQHFKSFMYFLTCILARGGHKGYITQLPLFSS